MSRLFRSECADFFEVEVLTFLKRLCELYEISEGQFVIPIGGVID